MSAPVYGYDDATLNAVITATSDSIGKMEQVNAQVLGLSSQLPQVNRSTSGTKLGGLLADWTAEYKRVVGELQALNEKANGILITNRNVETDTGAAPQ
jgi:hypothetical protein